MKSGSSSEELHVEESEEERRARHENTHSRLRNLPKDEAASTDRRLLHGAVLATNSFVEQDVDVDDESIKGKAIATVEPDTADADSGQAYFSKKLRRSTPQSREALLKLLASSKRKGRVTFDFGLKGMWEDLVAAITFKRPIKPASRLRTIWDAIILMLVCYGMFMIPFDIAFDVARMPWMIFDIALDIFFMLDLGLNFLTAYMSEDNELVMDFRKIRNHYLSTWFFIDLIASLPFGIISYTIQDGSEAYQVLKLLKAFRLFRMSYLYRVIALLSSLKGPFLVCVLMVFFGIAAHWFACLYWALAVMEGIENSWVANQLSMGHLAQRDQASQYFVCLYWAMATVTTLGYGDVTPHTFVEVLYVTFVIFCGAAMYAILVSSVSMIVVGRFTGEAEYNRHMDSLQAFSKLYHLPPDVSRRLVAYYDFIWERRRNFSNQSIMDDLPFELRAIVAGAVHAKMIQHNPLLASCDSFGFKHMFAAKISQIVLRLPDEVLHFEGDPVTDVFFVRRGLVDVVVGLDTVDELVVGKRQDGGHLGDIGLFEGGFYAASGVTVHFSEVCSINAKALLDLLDQFPRERALFEAVAKARAAAIERLLMEFDELAAGKLADDAGESPRAKGAVGPEKKQRTFLTRLMGHETTDSDFEFFWKLWEHAVSPETDEMLVETTARLPTVYDEEQAGLEVKASSMKSATVRSASPQHAGIEGVGHVNAAGGVAMAGSGDRGSSHRLKSFVLEASSISSQQRSTTEIPTRSQVFEAAPPASPSLRPRGESNANLDSMMREFDAFTQVRRPESVRASPTELGASFQDIVLAKLDMITARLDSLETSGERSRFRRRGESMTTSLSTVPTVMLA